MASTCSSRRRPLQEVRHRAERVVRKVERAVFRDNDGKGVACAGEVGVRDRRERRVAVGGVARAREAEQVVEVVVAPAGQEVLFGERQPAR